MQSSYFKSALTWLPELLLRVVLVLAGWGATHLGAFFANRARVVLIAAFLLSFVFVTAFQIAFYLGQVLAEPGIMFALRSPLAILIVAASVPFVVKRMNREEQILLDHFGDRYRSYSHVRIVFCRISTNTDQIGYRLENVPSGGE